MTVFHGDMPITHEIRGKLFMKTCTFAGHREVFASGVEADIDSAIETILANDSDFVFYTGGMGEFDSRCSAAVRKAKRTQPEKRT